MRILVAETDAPLAEFLSLQLQEEHFAVRVAQSEREALRLAYDQPFDLVLLDLGSKGLDALLAIRAKKPDLPILVITRESQAAERIRGLDAGADDYLAKPFAYAELSARIHAVLRRGNHCAHALLKVEDLEVDRISHSVRRGGREISLSPKEFALLELLMRNQGSPVSRESILEQIWKFDFDTMTNVVDVYINYLRRKLELAGRPPLIRTVRGVGYQIATTQSSIPEPAAVLS
jgi:DNA-binding response OmpR family regulator